MHVLCMNYVQQARRGRGPLLVVVGQCASRAASMCQGALQPGKWLSDEHLGFRLRRVPARCVFFFGPLL